MNLYNEVNEITNITTTTTTNNNNNDINNNNNNNNWLIVKTTKILLILIGIFHLDHPHRSIFPNDEYCSRPYHDERTYTIMLNCFYVFTFAGQLTKLVRTFDNLLAVFDVTFCAFGFVNCYVYLHVIKRNADKVRRIAQRIVGQIGTEYVDDDYYRRTSDHLKIFCTLCGPPYFAAVILFSGFPLMIVLCTNVTPGEPVTMIYPSSYPWQINNVRSYLLTMTCVQLPSISVPSFTYTAIVGFVVCTIISLKQHFRIVRKRVHQLTEKKLDQPYERGRHDMLHEEFYDDLKRIIIHHQFIMGYIQDVMSCFRGIVTGTLTTFFAVMVMIPFLVTTIEGYYLYRMKMICAATVILIIFFIYCFIVEMINDLNESLGKALYNIPWYRSHVAFRELLPIFIAQIQYRYEMKTFGMFAVNRAFFARVMKLNFSVLNMTLNLRANEQMNKYSIRKVITYVVNK